MNREVSWISGSSKHNKTREHRVSILSELDDRYLVRYESGFVSFIPKNWVDS